MVYVIDFGRKDYGEVLDIQTKLFTQLINRKKECRDYNEYILIGEHQPVITVGRRGKESNILLPENKLRDEGINVYKIGRGGDVTFHCPGQLILYPIIDLEKHGLGVKEYVDILEESVIRLLVQYGIKGERIEGATGVWIGKGTPDERKICAIGIKCSRFCSMHGLSLNVDCELEGFSKINPCGFQDKGVTSMQMEKQEFQNNKFPLKPSLNSPGNPIINISSQNDEIDCKILNFKEIKSELLSIFLSLVFPFEEVLNLSE